MFQQQNMYVSDFLPLIDRIVVVEGTTVLEKAKRIGKICEFCVLVGEDSLCNSLIKCVVANSACES